MRFFLLDGRRPKTLVPGRKVLLDPLLRARDATRELVEIIARAEIANVLLPFADVADLDDCHGGDPAAQGVLVAPESPLTSETPLGVDEFSAHAAIVANVRRAGRAAGPCSGSPCAVSFWLDEGELRVGLGCMRLVDDAPIVAALEAGITVFDTARAYPGNERLVAGAIRGRRARLVTKGGMGEGWVPNGRAKSLRADCEASLVALDGVAIDLYLVHTPDPRTAWSTTVRALARLADEGLVARVGICNVNRRQLDEALALAPIAAVQVALSARDEHALRGGLVDRCLDVGLTLIAHSPLGGPRRARRLSLDEAERELAALLAVAPNVVVIPGASRPETARSAARAAAMRVDAPKVRPSARPPSGAEVVLVMGIPGAGKSRLAAEYTARDYARINRDERGGTLHAVAEELDARLAAGVRSVVLDNTYLTRSARSYVVDAARRRGAVVRCVWLDTPLAAAQVNLVERILDRVGRLPSPEELRTLARSEPGLLLPTSQLRAARELEEPSLEEGFAEIDRMSFVRARGQGRAGVFVAAAALGNDTPDASAPHLVFDWRPDGTPLHASIQGAELVETAVCPHPGGPPACWCRPPLPGLPLEFARSHGVDPASSVLIGCRPAHRALAAALGARYIEGPQQQEPYLSERSERT
jgi:aryl-alcohol dehydrogenase-like predicted oxidoreductase